MIDNICEMTVRVRSTSLSSSRPMSAAHSGLSEMRSSAFAAFTLSSEMVKPMLMKTTMRLAPSSSSGLRCTPRSSFAGEPSKMSAAARLANDKRM